MGEALESKNGVLKNLAQNYHEHKLNIAIFAALLWYYMVRSALFQAGL
jgi:hypothetical protein